MKNDEAAKTLNYAAWLHGVYVNRAIASAFPKGPEYPKAPFGEEKKTKPADKFKAWAAGFNAQFKKGGEVDGRS